MKASSPKQSPLDSQTLNRESIPEQLFSRLSRAIASGEIGLGERLREGVLAKKLSVSQSSVREAIQLLCYYGLAVREPHRGSHVISFTKKEVVERVQVRTELECFAIREAKRSINEKSLKLLKSKLAALKASVTSKDYLLIGQRDFEFHRALWELSENRTLISTLERVCLPLGYVYVKLGAYKNFLTELIESHIPVMEALEHGTVEEAEESIRKHINDGWLTVFGESLP